MKIRVLKKFRDKDSLEIHEQGDIVEYPLERAKFIISLGFAEKVKEVQEKAEATEKKFEEKPKKKTTKSRGAVK